MAPYATLPALGALLALALWLAPHIALGEAATELASFFGAIASSIGALWAMARGSDVRLRRITTLAAILAMLACAVLKPQVAWAAIIVDLALVSLAHVLGSAIGGRVQHAGHLLPATVVAACADVISISHPQGPTHAIVESEQAMSLLAFAFPVPGHLAMAPALGAGDLVFTALWLAAAVKHRLSTSRVALGALLGALISGLVSAALQTSVPALPAIGALLLLLTPAARRLEGRDKQISVYAIVIAVALAIFVFIKERLLPS